MLAQNELVLLYSIGLTKKLRYKLITASSGLTAHGYAFY